MLTDSASSSQRPLGATNLSATPTATTTAATSMPRRAKPRSGSRGRHWRQPAPGRVFSGARTLGAGVTAVATVRQATGPLAFAHGARPGSGGPARPASRAPGRDGAGAGLRLEPAGFESGAPGATSGEKGRRPMAPGPLHGPALPAQAGFQSEQEGTAGPLPAAGGVDHHEDVHRAPGPGSAHAAATPTTAPCSAPGEHDLRGARRSEAGGTGLCRRRKPRAPAASS